MSASIPSPNSPITEVTEFCPSQIAALTLRLEMPQRGAAAAMDTFLTQLVCRQSLASRTRAPSFRFGLVLREAPRPANRAVRRLELTGLLFGCAAIMRSFFFMIDSTLR